MVYDWRSLIITEWKEYDIVEYSYLDYLKKQAEKEESDFNTELYFSEKNYSDCIRTLPKNTVFKIGNSIWLFIDIELDQRNTYWKRDTIKYITKKGEIREVEKERDSYGWIKIKVIEQDNNPDKYLKVQSFKDLKDIK